MTSEKDPGGTVRNAIMSFMVLLEGLIAKPGLSDTKIGELTGTSRTNAPNIRASISKHLQVSFAETKIEREKFYSLSEEDARKFKLLVPVAIEWQQKMILSWLMNNRPLILREYAPDEMRKFRQVLGLVFPGIPDAVAMKELRRCTYFSPVGKTNDIYNSWNDKNTDAVYLEELYTAMDECRSLRIGFVKRSGQVEMRCFNPILFFEKQGTSYILVEDSETKALRILRPNSIRSIDPLESEDGSGEERRFVPRGREEYHNFIDCTFGNFYPESLDQLDMVRIRFSSKVRDYVSERTWTNPEYQRFEDQADGGTILSLRTFCNDELIRWIAGFGRDARILEPAHLREKVLDVHRNAAMSWTE